MEGHTLTEDSFCEWCRAQIGTGEHDDVEKPCNAKQRRKCEHYLDLIHLRDCFGPDGYMGDGVYFGEVRGYDYEDGIL